MISDKSAAAAVDAVTHIDVITISGALLVLLIVAIRYIFNINLRLIDEKIAENSHELEKFSAKCEQAMSKLEDKLGGVESMAASAGMRVQKLHSNLDSTTAVQKAHIDRTDRDIDKLETRLTEIEKTIKDNHAELTKELSTITKNVAVLISKAEK
jgi:chromosome segregation ATPase